VDYNPHRPRIVGQEWVPIREEDAVDLTYAPAGTVEYGNNFTLTAAKALQEVRFYSHDINGILTMLANVYPLTDETEMGPVHRVLIPCNNGSITGTNTSFQGGANAAACLLNLDDNNYVNVPFNATASPPDTTGMQAYFAVNQYAQLLNGKRILQVNLLYDIDSNIQTMADTFTPSANADISMTLSVQVNDGSTSYTLGSASTDWTEPGVVIPFNFDYDAPSHTRGYNTFRIGLGNLTRRSTTPTVFPWTYTDLARFEISATDRLAIKFGTSTNRGDSTATASNVANRIHYMALEVIYCEETRVAVGVQSGFLLGNAPNPETQVITMYNLAKTANPILQAGNYRMTVSSALYSSALAVPTNSTPALPSNGKGLRELYALPTLSSVKILIPNPYDETIEGKVVEGQATHIIPQLTAHTTGGAGVFTEVHPYGNQAVAQVYGSVTASQVIQDSVLAGSNSYPWVRWYARRFGNTSQPLVLSSTSATVSGSSASISVAEFDALNSIIDGWKEVTLRFTTAPSLGAGTNPTWRWSSAAETAGNRWEVLGAAAPAISAIPGNFIQEVASAQRLGAATYGAPSAGATVALSWVPGITPPVSASTLDAFSDAALMFAMDMPTVTNLTLVATNQPLTGIGLNCSGGVGCCQPTGLTYNQVTWTATSSSIPVSGFGYYELQRMDTISTDWATIMQNTSPTGASFKDYEARVGIQSTYRIRAVDVLDFPGQWSSEVTITPASPGVTGGSCISQGHVLIFTSNAVQDGSINLAYSTAWMGSSIVEEPFTFPEAGQNVVQMMFDKDFPTVFRPLERGGEQFTRTLLVQAAAISPPTAGNFRSLRNMAWDDVPYVCVRDEDGNRWFATVIVPGGNILRDRRLYLATVNVIETSDTPYAVTTT
jgi:hypothetical protein